VIKRNSIGLERKSEANRSQMQVNSEPWMKSRPIDVWNANTFDRTLIRLLEANADVIQGYMKTDHEIFTAYDNYNGPNRPLLRPDNPYAARFYAFQEAMGEEMKARIVRAFHYTRMTDAEIAILRRQGIHLSTPATLRARLDALVAGGSLSAPAANSLYDASPFYSDQLESRSNKFWMVSHPIAIEDTGVEPLMSHWGGEVSSMWMRDPTYSPNWRVSERPASSNWQYRCLLPTTAMRLARQSSRPLAVRAAVFRISTHSTSTLSSRGHRKRSSRFTPMASTASPTWAKATRLDTSTSASEGGWN
jgi:hypothetical protein